MVLLGTTIRLLADWLEALILQLIKGLLKAGGQLLFWDRDLPLFTQMKIEVWLRILPKKGL